MRIVDSIPHPKFTISIFAMNDKYQLKFEAGPMEQIYKISQAEVNGVEGIKKMVDEKFLAEVHERFNQMYLAFKSAKLRLTE